MTVLLTRPLADSESLARELKSHGISSLVEPLLTIHPQPFATASLDIARKQALLLTSKHALEGADTLAPLLHLPVLAVGDSTAAAARQAGFAQVTATGKQARDMVAYAQSNLDPAKGSLLYFSGHDITLDLAAALPHFSVRRIVTYQAEAATQFSPSLLVALQNGTIDTVVFFSSRTARSFESCLEQAGLTRLRHKLHAICISKAAAASLKASEWEQVTISTAPTAEAITRLVLATK